MGSLVRILVLMGVGFGVAGIALALRGEPLLGLAFVVVAIADVALALVLRRRAGH